MGSSNRRETVDFDHHTAEWVDDPYSVYTELRDHKPLAYSEAHGGFWLLSRFDDVRNALQDWQTFSSAFPGRIAIPHTRSGNNVPGIPIEVDPPKHTQYRAAVRHRFLRSAVGRLEPEMTRIARELIDGFVTSGGCDIVRDYATPLLGFSLAMFLGLPLQDVTQIEAWSNAIFANRSLDPEGARQAHLALAGYIAEHLEARKRDPRDDLFSELIGLEVDGRALSDEELIGYCRIILLAGREAVIDAISNTFWYLAQHPETRQQLIVQPGILHPAVEEFLRYFSPIQLLGRVATRDVTMHGQTIRKGESVAMLYGCANRDERAFPQADACHLDRQPNAHLAFGSGPHACMGAALARLDLRVAIREFLLRIPEFRLAPDAPARRKRNGDARGFVTLPIVF